MGVFGHGGAAASHRGRSAEEHVARLLHDAGWTILDRNWRGSDGELDLVVARDGVIRFVEVKARGEDGLDGLDAIGEVKRRRLRHAAEAWLAERGTPEVECAFLVALVELSGELGAAASSVAWWDDPF